MDDEVKIKKEFDDALSDWEVDSKVVPDRHGDWDVKFTFWGDDYSIHVWLHDMDRYASGNGDCPLLSGGVDWPWSSMLYLMREQRDQRR